VSSEDFRSVDSNPNNIHGFYQPETRQDFYLDCSNGTYCGVGAAEETWCPAGKVGSSSLANVDEASGCISCDAGFYSPADSKVCIPCQPGFVCDGTAASTAFRRFL
jgi:hypothetical protein